MLVLPIAEDLHELLKNRGMTTMTSLGELGRIVEVTINLAFMFVVRILRTEYRRAY